MRSASPTRREPALDGLRGLAVLLVYLYHYGGGLKSQHAAVRLLGHLTESGWVGVALFFALSGFLITGSLWDSLASPHWLRNFYARRSLRIFPLYFAALALSVFAATLTGTNSRSLWPFGIHILFLQDMPVLASIADRVPGPMKLYHLWTLAVEEHFYLLWPAVLLFAKTLRKALTLCLALFVASALFRLALFSTPLTNASAFNQFPLTHLGTLALGAALALLYRTTAWLTVQRFTLPALAIGIIGFAAVSFHAGSAAEMLPLQLAIGLPFVSLAAAATIPLALRQGWFSHLVSITALRFLGRISYGFYILHILLAHFYDLLSAHIAHANEGQHYQIIRLLLAFPITLALAWLSYRFLESPFLRLKHRFPTQPVNPRPMTLHPNGGTKNLNDSP